MSHIEHCFHIVWATKHRQPLLTAQREEAVFRCTLKIVRDMGYETLALNGMPDHVHLLLKSGPKIDTSALMQKVKGVASALVNDMTDHSENFRWQEGYYSVSVTPSHVRRVLAYVQNQKEHHAQGTTHPAWEYPEEEAADTSEPAGS